MMRTLDRYLVTTFLRSYIILLLVGIVLFIVPDLLINLDEFTENRELSLGQVLWIMLDYYGCNVPQYFSQLAGPVMAFAGAFTFAMMLRNNEMVALVAAGVRLQRLAVPVLVCAVGLVALWMVNREYVLPHLAHKIARHHDDITGVRVAGISFARDENDAFLTARRIHLPERRLDYVVIVEPPGRGGHSILADAAIYDPARKTWRLERGERIVEGGRGDDDHVHGIAREPVREYPFALAPEELLLRQSAQWAGMLSLRQMNELLTSRNLPNLAAVRMQRHIWLTQPMLQWLLLALALPFFLTREPGSVLVAGGRALLVCGAFFGVTFVAQGVVSAQWAALVAWVPILLFGPVAVLQLANVKT
ncbi:MAG: LptF/LptG family permease [Phycisphaerae bacterium]|jgi:lipopolysaccharide export LptBFGC system permease protein LptF